MPLPAGIATCDVNITVPVDNQGNVAKSFTGTIEIDRPLVWAATGEPIWHIKAKLPAPVSGVITVPVPEVDQAGMLDATTGAPVTHWEYTIRGTAVWGADRWTVAKRFQVFAATASPYDLDLAPASSILPAVEGEPFVSTVAGLSGGVTPQGLVDALATPLSAAIAGTLRTGGGTALATANGVVADGVTNDAPALNALIAAVSAFGGGTVKLPPSAAIRLNTPVIPKNNVTIEGSDGTVLKPLEHGFLFDTGTDTAPLTNAHFRDFTIDGSDRTSTWKGYHGQYHERCSWVNLHIKNTGMTGLGPDFLRGCVISGCTTENTGLDNDGTMPSGNGIGIGAGGWALTQESFLIVGCTAINAKRFGIMVEGGNDLTGAKIVGNFATACGDAGFGIGSGLGAIVEGNTAYANVGNGFELSNLTLASASPSGRAVVRGNYAHKNGGSGIVYDATVHRAASGQVQIVGNVCSENVVHGIAVSVALNLLTSETQISGFKIDGNTCVANGVAGIDLVSSGTSGSGWVPVAWTIDNNSLIRNAATTITPQMRIAAHMKGSSIRGNMTYHSTVSTSLDGIYIGFGGAAVTLDRCRIEDNTMANGSNTCVQVDAAATLTNCTIANNQPDAGSPAPKTVTTNYTATGADTTIISNGATIINLPTAASAGAGREYVVKNINATVVEVRVSDASNVDNTTVDRLAQHAAGTYVSDGTTWLKKGAVVGHSATLDFPSIAAGGVAELTMSVPGALTGEPVALGAPAAIEAGLMWSGWVSAANTVKIRLYNSTVAAVDPASAVWSARVLR